MIGENPGSAKHSKMSPIIDDAVNNDELLDSTGDNSSLPISSSYKRKLLHNNNEYAEKKVQTIKFNALNDDNNEVVSTEHLSNYNSYYNNNENSIKFIRSRRLKVLYLQIPNHESGKFIKPKGIFATKTIRGGFRIQLTLYTGKSEKYSKNTESFLDALWLFECAIILKDRPTMLSILLNSGNFAALLSYGIISNEVDYYEELGRWVSKYSKTSHMSNEEMKRIICLYDNLVCCFQDVESGNLVVTFPSLAQNGKTVTSIVEPTRANNQIIELIQSNPDILKCEAPAYLLSLFIPWPFAVSHVVGNTFYNVYRAMYNYVPGLFKSSFFQTFHATFASLAMKTWFRVHVTKAERILVYEGFPAS